MIKQEDDYFACDDSAIRSPTYYTRTQREEDMFGYRVPQAKFTKEVPSTDLKSLLTPMWDDHFDGGNEPACGSKEVTFAS